MTSTSIKKRAPSAPLKKRAPSAPLRSALGASASVKARGARRVGRPSTSADAPDAVATVLGAVYELISREGVERFRMRAVAAEAGVSTGTINYHFKNRYQLLIAALEHAYQLPQDWEAYRGSPRAQLRRLLASDVFRSDADRWWRFWVKYTALATRDAAMQAHARERYVRQQAFWTQLIADGIAAGELRGELDPSEAAESLLVIAHGWMVRQLMMPDAETRTRARAGLERALAALKK